MLTRLWPPPAHLPTCLPLAAARCRLQRGQVLFKAGDNLLCMDEGVRRLWTVTPYQGNGFIDGPSDTAGTNFTGITGEPPLVCPWVPTRRRTAPRRAALAAAHVALRLASALSGPVQPEEGAVGL